MRGIEAKRMAAKNTKRHKKLGELIESKFTFLFVTFCVFRGHSPPTKNHLRLLRRLLFVVFDHWCRIFLRHLRRGWLRHFRQRGVE